MSVCGAAVVASGAAMTVWSELRWVNTLRGCRLLKQTGRTGERNPKPFRLMIKAESGTCRQRKPRAMTKPTDLTPGARATQLFGHAEMCRIQGYGFAKPNPPQSKLPILYICIWYQNHTYSNLRVPLFSSRIDHQVA